MRQLILAVVCLLALMVGVANADYFGTWYTGGTGATIDLTLSGGSYTFTEDFSFSDDATAGAWASNPSYYSADQWSGMAANALTFPGINNPGSAGYLIYNFVIPENVPFTINYSVKLRCGATLRAANVPGTSTSMNGYFYYPECLLAVGEKNDTWSFVEYTGEIPVSLHNTTSVPGSTIFSLLVHNSTYEWDAAGIDELTVTATPVPTFFTGEPENTAAMTLVDDEYIFDEDYSYTFGTLGDWADDAYRYAVAQDPGYGDHNLTFYTGGGVFLIYKFVVPVENANVTYSAQLRCGATLRAAANVGTPENMNGYFWPDSLLAIGEKNATWSFVEYTGSIPASVLNTTVPGETSFSLLVYNGTGEWEAAGLDHLSITATPSTSTPTFSSGKYISAARDVEISCASAGAVIYYTTDGTDPTTSSAVYSSAIAVTDGTTIKAIAEASPLPISPIASITFEIPASYDRVETIKSTDSVTVDGDFSDWAGCEWAPLNQAYDGAGAVNVTSASYAAQWDESGDKVYLAVKVLDTDHSFTDDYNTIGGVSGWNTRDAIEVYIHTTSNGDVNYSATATAAQQYAVGVTASDHNQVWTSLLGKDYVISPSSFEAVGSADDGSGWIYYEMSITPYAFFGDYIGSANVISPLAEGDVIGLDVCVVDHGIVSGYAGMKSENLKLGKSVDWEMIGLHTLAVASLPGDANSDGAVDVGDLGILAANYGTTSGATWELGDFNGDGAVDVGDLGILAANYGAGSSGSEDFDADYAKIFGDEVDSEEGAADTLCGALGLPLIAGLLLVGLMLVKLDD